MSPSGQRTEPGLLTMSRAQRCGLAAMAVALLAVSLWIPVQSLLHGGADVAPQEAAGGVRVDVNRADWPELSLVPGLGKVISQRIVARREARGPYRSLEELLAVDGIGRTRLEDIRPFLVLGEKKRENAPLP